MAKYIHIQVETPCHEKWEHMQASVGGSFCNSCRKTVIDFTGMTDTQLLEYVKKHPSGVCGRFYNDQLETTLKIPAKKIPWLKYFFRITLPAMLFSYKANAQKLIKKNPETVVVTDKKNHQSIALAPGFMLSGKVTGQNGEPVPFASVSVPGTNEGTVADSNGLFRFRPTSAGRILEITAVGYESREVALSGIYADIKLNVATNENIVLPTVLVTSSRSTTMGLMSFIRVTRISNTKKTEIAETVNSIELFPNPAQRTSQLTIRWKKPVTDDQQIILYNASGVKLLQKTIPVNQPLLQAHLSLNVNAAGYYLIQVVDSKTHEKKLAKLLVE
jgi:hypothetical protein